MCLKSENSIIREKSGGIGICIAIYRLIARPYDTFKVISSAVNYHIHAVYGVGIYGHLAYCRKYQAW